MTPSFNLVDEPWIPCAPRGELLPRDLGLRDALVGAHEIRELAPAHPLVSMAMTRLMLAILHRIFGPEDVAAWHQLWGRGRFAPEEVEKYLTRWRERFDLFDERRPFYQAASLKLDQARSVAKLFHEAAAGNNPALFDHSFDSAPTALPAAEVARQLIVHQSLALGGTASHERPDEKYTKSAPLVNSAVFIVTGKSLFETLMLNLHRYSPRNGEPFEMTNKDAPAWETEDEPAAGERYSLGYLDLLTWQSRRIRLRPETNSAGETRVRWGVVMKGQQFPGGYTLHGKETMVAFQKARSAKDGDPWPPLGFREGRALWRDSLPILQRSGAEHARPRMLDWLAELDLDSTATIGLQAIGLASFQGKPEFWRGERLTLTRPYVEGDPGLLETLRRGLELAKEVGTVLGPGFVSVHTNGRQVNVRAPLRQLVSELGETGPNAGQVAASLGAERTYWAGLDAPFHELLQRLPADHRVGPDGSAEYGAVELPRWAHAARDSSREAFAIAVRGLQGSGRTLRAVAIAEREFERHLQRMVRPHLQADEEVKR